MPSNFTKATRLVKSMRDILVSDKAKAGEERFFAELGIEPPKCKGGGGGGRGRGRGHPRNKHKKKGGGARGGTGGGLQLHGYTDKQWHDLLAANQDMLRRRLPREKQLQPCRPKWLTQTRRRSPRKAAPSSARVLMSDSESRRRQLQQ
jgi:hypothetical protein